MTFYRTLMPALRDSGVSLRIIEGSALHNAPSSEKRVSSGICVETLERRRVDSWWSRLSDFGNTPDLRRHLAAAWAMSEQAACGAEFDVIEASDWGLLFVPPIIEAQSPVVVQCHGSVGQISDHDPITGDETDGRLIRLIEKAAMAQAGAVQAPSRANAEFWATETGRRVHMIRPAWQPIATMKQAITQRGLVVGRVQRWKGPHVVCAALNLLGERAPKIDWFGRDTSWERRGYSSAAHLSSMFPDIWQKKVLHHTPIAAEEVASQQAAALFNLIPSTWDTFNFTVVEAMSSGRPTIVSTGAGASELIEDGANGFLFPPGDATALAAAIEHVQSETPTRLCEIGKAAQETVERELRPEKIVAERISAYRTAIDNFRKNPPKPVHGWLASACRCSTENACESMAFLDRHPLRTIVSYSMRRFARRLWSH